MSGRFKPAPAPVTSVFSRTGVIAAAEADYDAAQVTYDPTNTDLVETVAQDAIDALWTRIFSLEGAALPAVVDEEIVAARQTSFAALNFREGDESSVLQAGVYRVTVYVKAESVEVASSLNLMVGWSDAVGAKTALLVDSFALDEVDAHRSASITVQTDGVADLTLSGDFTDAGDGEYSLYAICERLA